jgi:hypothetical protein
MEHAERSVLFVVRDKLKAATPESESKDVFRLSLQPTVQAKKAPSYI